MPKRIYHKEIKMGPGEVSARQALKMIASQQPEWTDNPAIKLFPFYIPSQKKKPPVASGTGQSNESHKIDLKRKVLYRDKKKKISRTRIVEIDGISLFEVEEMWRALKKSKKIIMDAIHGGNIEIKKCTDLEPCSIIDNSYYNIIRRKSWTLLCTGYFPINEGGKTTYYYLVFRERDIKKLINHKIFERNKQYRPLEDFEKKRIKHFFNGPLEQKIQEFQRKHGQDAIPKFNPEQRMDIAEIAIKRPIPNECEEHKGKPVKAPAAQSRKPIFRNALNEIVKKDFPNEFITRAGGTAENFRDNAQKIMNLMEK